MIQKNKLLVVGIVALLAYYLYDRNRKMRLVADLKDGANTDFVQEVSVNKKTESDCKKEWEKKLGMIRFRTDEARQESKNNYIASCLKNQ